MWSKSTYGFPQNWVNQGSIDINVLVSDVFPAVTFDRRPDKFPSRQIVVFALLVKRYQGVDPARELARVKQQALTHLFDQVPEWGDIAKHGRQSGAHRFDRRDAE